jgi:hypothetical protein
LATYQAQWFLDTAKMPLAEEILQVNLEQPSFRIGAVWPSLRWCLPCFLGFLAFLFSFPIYRQIPFWPHLSIAEIVVMWFGLITPVTTLIAIITLIKRRRAGGMTTWVKLLAWTVIALCLIINAFVILGMAG